MILSKAARRLVPVAACAVAMLVATESAQAYETAPGWIATDYVTGFDHGSQAGPVGLAFDRSGNLLFADSPGASLHKVPPGGGTAAATKIRDGYGQAEGLAFSLDGR